MAPLSPGACVYALSGFLFNSLRLNKIYTFWNYPMNYSFFFFCCLTVYESSIKLLHKTASWRVDLWQLCSSCWKEKKRCTAGEAVINVKRNKRHRGYSSCDFWAKATSWPVHSIDPVTAQSELKYSIFVCTLRERVLTFSMCQDHDQCLFL